MLAADGSPTGTDYSGPIITAIIGAISLIIVAMIPVIGNLMRRPAATPPPAASGPTTGERLLKLDERVSKVIGQQHAAGSTHRADVEAIQNTTRQHREWVDEELRRIRERIEEVDDKVDHHLWGDHGQPRQ